MKRILTLLFAIALFTSCENDNDAVAPIEIKENVSTVVLSVSAFKESTKLSFQGNLNGETFNWQFASGDQNYQSTRGFCYAGKAEPCNPNRNFTFGLSQNTRVNHLKVQIPTINVTSTAEFNRVFGLGRKELSDFKFTIIKGNTTLELSETAKNAEIEILKTAEVQLSNSEKIMRVWFRIRGEFENTEYKQTTVPVDGLLLAEFPGYDFNAGSCGTAR